MREGRRRRLGLLTGTEGTVGDTYLDRILGDVDVAGESNILSLDPDANVRTTDQRYLSDAYNYYLGGGFPEETTDPIQDFTGGETIGTGAGDVAQIPGAIDTLVAPDTRPPEFVTGITGGTDIDPYTPGIMEDEYDVDTIPDYPGAGTASPIAEARGTPISEMGTRPPDFVAGAKTFTDPEPSGGRLALGRADVTPEIQTPPGGGDPDMFYDEPVNLVEQDFSGRPVLAARGATTPEYSVTRPAGIDTPMIDPAETITGPTMADVAGPITDYQGEVTADQGFETLPTEEKTNIIQTAWNKAQEMGGDLMSNFQNNLTGKLSMPQLGSLMNFIRDPSLLASGSFLGIPGMILGGIGQALGTIPQYEPTFEERTLEEEIGVTEDGKFSGDPTESAFAGLNAVSTFGDPVETAKDRIETRLDTIEENPDISTKFKNDTQTMIEEWEAVTDKIGDVEGPIDTLGDTEVSLTQRFADQAAAEKAEADRAMQEQIATAEAAQAQAAKIEAQRRALQVINAPQVSGGQGGQGGGYQGGGGQAAADVGGGSWGYSPFRKGGRVGYGKGGIVDLLK
jgi:hypothetical protein